MLAVWVLYILLVAICSPHFEKKGKEAMDNFLYGSAWVFGLIILVLLFMIKYLK